MSTPLHQPRTRVPRIAEQAVERARLTVVPRRATAAPRVPFVTLVSVLLVGGVVGLLLFNTNMQQASFVASNLEERAAVLAGKEESLRMQIHRLRDPQHVAARAKKLGMVPSSSPAFIRLSDGKVLGRPAVAEPGASIRISELPPAKPRPQLVIAEAPRAEAALAREDRSRGRSRAAERRRGRGGEPGASGRARASEHRDTARSHAASRRQGAGQRTNGRENGSQTGRTP